ncbi:hypothetical protein ACHAXS_008273, partial [Conticribra weissflogii]
RRRPGRSRRGRHDQSRQNSTQRRTKLRKDRGQDRGGQGSSESFEATQGRDGFDEANGSFRWCRRHDGCRYFSCS